MRKNIIILLISIAAVIETSGIPFEDCGSGYDLRQVDIAQCIKAPCKLTIGTNVNVTAKFIANFQSQRLENNVFFFLNNVELDAAVLDLTCPPHGICVDPSTEIKEYTAEMVVSDVYPPVPGQLVWQIFNENGLQVICFRAAISLVI